MEFNWKEKFANRPIPAIVAYVHIRNKKIGLIIDELDKTKKNFAWTFLEIFHRLQFKKLGKWKLNFLRIFRSKFK